MSSEMKALDLFVKESLKAGETKESIIDVLEKAGWPKDQALSAVANYADLSFKIPVPKPRLSLSARESFLYLVMFFALYYSAFHLGSVLFDFINRYVPDDLRQAYGSFESMRWSISSLIVSFPIFLFLAAQIAKDVNKNPVKRLSGVRRWVTYITLFVACSILIGDATALIYNVLGGELTVRFILKSMVVAIISGTIFGYYLYDLHSDEKNGKRIKTGKTLALSALGVVLVVIVTAIVQNPPALERAREFDQMRVSQLSMIESKISNYAIKNNRLPERFDSICANCGNDFSDPETKIAYEYILITEKDYQLCAQFAGATADESAHRLPYPQKDWRHQAGRYCFDLTARLK